MAGASLVGGITVLEPEPLPAFSRYAGPNDRVRFGIVGVGMEGTGLLTNAIQLPGVECVAACDLYDGRHELAKEIVGKPIKTTRRYKELLDDKEIDAIIVAVPDHWHKQVVVDTLAAGKDVYCEKPMSHSAADGVAMVAAAKKTDRISQIGAQRTSSVLCAKAKEMIASGAIGELEPGGRQPGPQRSRPERGNIRRRRICLQKIWIGIPGWAPHRRNRLIRIYSRAGAAGRNTEPAWRATCSCTC